jgi:hypothetical protein
MMTRSGKLATALLLSCGCAATATGSNNQPGGYAANGGFTVGAPMVAAPGANKVGTGGVSGGTGGAKASGTVVAPPAVGTGGVGMAPATGGMMAPKLPGTGGMGMGTGGKAAPAGMPAPAGAMDPVIPMVTGDCPMFVNGTITYMGLGGITVEAGPKAAEKSAPMVFYWHGTGSTSGEYAFMATAVQQGVIAEGGVLISFQDTTGGDLLSGTAIFGASDFKLTDQLLACAVRDHNIDPRRVFATGCSAGGLFSAAMAAERSSYLAAAAPNSGGWTVPVAFENGHTPALMTIHGAPGSDVVGIDFSQSSATADMAFKARGGFVVNCNHGGGHCGGGGLAPDIWTFFKAHPFGVSPEPWTALPAGFNSVCMIQ